MKNVLGLYNTIFKPNKGLATLVYQDQDTLHITKTPIQLYGVIKTKNITIICQLAESEIILALSEQTDVSDIFISNKGLSFKLKNKSLYGKLTEVAPDVYLAELYY